MAKKKTAKAVKAVKAASNVTKKARKKPAEKIAVITLHFEGQLPRRMVLRRGQQITRCCRNPLSGPGWSLQMIGLMSGGRMPLVKPKKARAT